MGVFRFKSFEVRNDRSAMKVNTDGVLLGALMTVTGRERRLLDIGTGTGTIALMAAQRLAGAAGHPPCNHIAGDRPSYDRPPCDRFPYDHPFDNRQETRPEIIPAIHPGIRLETPSETSPEIPPFIIDAIDIDAASAEEAGVNFRNSPWVGHLHAHHSPLSLFRPSGEYDLIFSNPPFFTETLHSPSERKAKARHADSLPAEEIMSFAAAHLGEKGVLSLILPSEQEIETRRTAAVHSLGLFRTVSIRSSDRKPAYRTVMEFSRDTAGLNAEVSRERVTINMNGKYSEQYLDIVSDFLLLQRT